MVEIGVPCGLTFHFDVCKQAKQRMSTIKSTISTPSLDGRSKER